MATTAIDFMMDNTMSLGLIIGEPYFRLTGTKNTDGSGSHSRSHVHRTTVIGDEQIA